MTSLVLLTGAAGRSGSYLVRNLAASPDPDRFRFRAVVRPSTDTTALDESGLDAEFVVGDLEDAAFLDRAMHGVDVVFHIAGIQRSLGVVRAALANGVRRLVLVHTTGIYSTHKSASADYLAIEAEIARLVAGHDVALTILRPTMIYGSTDDHNISTFLRLVDRLRLFPVVNGGHYGLQPVHHGDLGRAYFAVLMDPEATAGRNYVLSGGTPIDLIDILRLMSADLGKRTAFVSVPFGVAYAGARAVHAVTGGRIDLREKVQRLVEPRTFAHDDATRDFGYAPMPFADGLRAEVAAYRALRGSRP